MYVMTEHLGVPVGFLIVGAGSQAVSDSYKLCDTFLLLDCHVQPSYDGVMYLVLLQFVMPCLVNVPGGQLFSKARQR